MKLYVRGRQGGKTQSIVNWLLEGKVITVYPYWSRVIVCPDRASVWQVRRRVHDALVRTHVSPSTFKDICNAVWSVEDLTAGRRNDMIEVGIDNIDMLLTRFLRYRPAFGTITGEVINGSDTQAPSSGSSEAEGASAGGSPEARDSGT